MTRHVGSAGDRVLDGGPSAAGLRNATAKGSMWIAISQVSRTLLQIVVQLALARLLLPAEFGLVALAAPITTLALLFANIGLGEAIVQREDLTESRLSEMFWLSVVFIIGIAIVLVAVAPGAAFVYGERSVFWIIAASSAILVVTGTSMVPTALLNRQMRFGTLAINEVVVAVVGALASVAAAVVGLSYWSLIIGQGTGAVVGVALVWRSAHWRPSRFRITRAVRADAGFGLHLTGAQLGNYVTATADNYIVGLLNGKTALGLYDRSYRLVVQPVEQAMSPISRVAVPVLSRLQTDPRRYNSAYLKMLRVTFWFTLPIMAVCVALPREVVLLLLGENWRAAAPIFGWMAVGGLGSGLYSTLTWLFVSQGRTKEFLRMTSVIALLTLCSFVVGARWGAVGVAAAGSLVFIVVLIPLGMLWATSRGPVHRGDFFKVVGLYAVVAAASTGLARASVFVPHTSLLISLLIAGAAALLPVAAVVLLGRVESQLLHEGITALRRTLAERLSRRGLRNDGAGE